MLEVNKFEPDVIVVGVGFVGLTISMALCQAGMKVLGIDNNEILVKELNEGVTSVTDPGIREILNSQITAGNFRTINVGETWQRTNRELVFIITVGTPLKDGKVSSDSIIEATYQISEQVQNGDLIILRSTVSIGTSRNLVWPILCQNGQKVCLAMCPERTIEGDALNEIQLLPQIIGGIDELSSNRAKNFFRRICNEVIEVSSIESAEFLKLANNTYRDLMFSFANELTSLASRIGISAREVIDAANRGYPRSKIAMPGPSGGPCLEKDPWILWQSGLNYGLSMNIASASRIVNESTTLTFVNDCLSSGDFNSTKKKVGLLGLSFKGKPPVVDARGSFAKQIIESDVKSKFDFYGYEPAGEINVEGCITLESLSDVLRIVDAIVICTNHEDFVEVPQLIRSLNVKTSIIVDMWSMLDCKSLPKETSYHSWG